MQADFEAEVLATNLRVIASLHRALDLLAGLPVVVFKGPILTARLYGSLGARASADCDLWVPEPGARVALERFLAAGFVASPGLDPFAALAWRGQVALWPGGDHGQVSVDLHARPFARPYFEVDDSVLREHLEVDTTFGRAVTTFDERLAFCHSVAHYVQHHLADARLDVVQRLAGRLALEQASVATSASAADADPGLVDLIERTVGGAAVELALRRAASQRGTTPGPCRHRRAAQVEWVLAAFKGAPPGVVRKFAALYLASPGRLPSGMWAAAFPPSDVLHEQYGIGSRAGLLVRHLLRVLGER